MEENGAIVGLVSGMKSSTHPDVFFLWQIGVARELRGKKLSYLLLEKIEEVAKRLNCRRMQFTIESDNDESLSMFQGFARKRGVELSAIGKAEFPHSKLNTIWVETIYELPI
jgi:L-2,4-diaminobutyric acid acetyltransferase